MLTYQVRPRVFRLTSGEKPTFPAHGEICFYFQPPQPFGARRGGGRRARRQFPDRVLRTGAGKDECDQLSSRICPLTPRRQQLGQAFHMGFLEDRKMVSGQRPDVEFRDQIAPSQILMICGGAPHFFLSRDQHRSLGVGSRRVGSRRPSISLEDPPQTLEIRKAEVRRRKAQNLRQIEQLSQRRSKC